MVWALQGPPSFVWPKELESKSHDKGNKKGELTALLSDLATLEAQHRKLDFPFPPSKGSVEKATDWGQDAGKFFTGTPMKQLVGGLQVVSKRATALEKTKISSDAKTSLKAIRTCCDAHAAAMAQQKILPEINSITRALVEADKAHVLKNLRVVLTSFKACAAKGHPGIDTAKRKLGAWPADASTHAAAASSVGVDLYNDCRDMTQNVQNLLKAVEYGTDLTLVGLQKRDIDTLPKLAKSLIPIANAKSGVGTGKSKDELILLTKSVDANAKLFDQISSRIA